MGLRLVEIFYSYSAGIDFRRQNLASNDVIFGRLKSVPALKGLKAYYEDTTGKSFPETL